MSERLEDIAWLPKRWLMAARQPSMTATQFRDARHALGMTQRYLARLLGTTAQTLNRWENGKNKVYPPAQILVSLMLQEHADERLSP